MESWPWGCWAWERKSWKGCEKFKLEPLWLDILRRKWKRRMNNEESGVITQRMVSEWENIVRNAEVRRRMGFVSKGKKNKCSFEHVEFKVLLRHLFGNFHEALEKYSKSFIFTEKSMAGLWRWDRWGDKEVITSRRTNIQNVRSEVQKGAKVKKSRHESWSKKPWAGMWLMWSDLSLTALEYCALS